MDSERWYNRDLTKFSTTDPMRFLATELASVRKLASVRRVGVPIVTVQLNGARINTSRTRTRTRSMAVTVHANAASDSRYLLASRTGTCTCTRATRAGFGFVAISPDFTGLNEGSPHAFLPVL